MRLTTVSRALTCSMLIVSAACAPESAAGKLQDDLQWAASQMALRGQNERVVTYTHDRPIAYTLLIAPSGTTLDTLRSRGLRNEQAQLFTHCLGEEPALAILDKDRASCVRPVTLPQLSVALVVEKAAGVDTEIVLRRDGESSRVVSLK